MVSLPLVGGPLTSPLGHRGRSATPCLVCPVGGVMMGGGVVDSMMSGVNPTNETLIKFWIILKCVNSYFLSDQSDHNEILNIPRQHSCLGMCKILLWSDQSSWYHITLMQLESNRNIISGNDTRWYILIWVYTSQSLQVLVWVLGHQG